MQIELTSEEVELIVSGLKKLDNYDLDIECEYDWGDSVAVQMDHRLSPTEKSEKYHLIQGVLYEAQEKKEIKLKPLFDKLGVNFEE